MYLVNGKSQAPILCTHNHWIVFQWYAAYLMLEPLWWRANARNVSFWITLPWPIDIINPVDKTKLSFITPHQCSTTVSWETFPLYIFAIMYSALIFTRVVLDQGRLLQIATANNQNSAHIQADSDLDSVKQFFSIICLLVWIIFHFCNSSY